LQTKSIPKILHSIWIGNDKPNMDLRKKWEWFDGWELIHWTDDKIKSHFKDDLLTQLYENEGPTKISDYVRLLILKEFGGVYSDVDVMFLKPINEFINLKAFISYQFPKIENPKLHTPKGMKLRDHFEGKSDISLFEYFNEDIYLNNSIIGSIPNSKFIDTFINVYKEDYQKPIKQRFSFVDYGCGPSMTTYVGKQFAELNGETVHTDELSIFNYSYFHPSNYIENKEALRTRDFKQNFAEQIKKGIALNSYCVHIQSSSECDNYRK